MQRHLSFRRLNLAVIALLVALCPLSLCRAIAQSTNTPIADQTELPTNADRQLAARYSALAQEMDKSRSPARELIYATTREQIAQFLEALNATESVNRWLLFRARRYMGRVLPQLEALKRLAPPPPYSVTKRHGEIKVDGKLDEAAWRRALPLEIRFDHLKKIEGEAATVRLLWDEKFLYAAFTVPDADMTAPPVERDGPVWENDCVELFLLPDRNQGVYWEIEISATGDIYDALCTKYSDHWGSDMKVEKSLQGLQFGRALQGTPNQSEDRDEGYTVEVAVPFDQLPGFAQNPRGGDRIYGLLGHVNRDGTNDSTALAQIPYAGWFHNIWMYQPLVLER
jgi:hypothetical protein